MSQPTIWVDGDDDPYFFDGFLEDLTFLWIDEPPLSFLTTEEEAEVEEAEEEEEEAEDELPW